MFYKTFLLYSTSQYLLSNNANVKYAIFKGKTTNTSKISKSGKISQMNKPCTMSKPIKGKKDRMISLHLRERYKNNLSIGRLRTIERNRPT